MGSIFTSLINTAETLKAFERALQVGQNNVANAATPGFARQRVSFEAKRFEPNLGILGGVGTDQLLSSRSPFAEQAVWRQQHEFGKHSQQRAQLTALEPIFRVDGHAGIPRALDQLFNAFSQLTVAPNDVSVRQIALERAGSVAREFNQTAAMIGQAVNNADRQLRSYTEQINSIANRIAALNRERRANFANDRDPGTDAVFHRTLEELAAIVNFAAVESDDGGIAIYLGGQSLLVIADRVYPIEVGVNNNGAFFHNAIGDDITDILDNGRLGATLEFRNVQLASYRAEIDQLAATLADAVNQTLAAGIDANGNSPAIDLFTYDPANPAATLRRNGLLPEELALALPSGPGGNGNALNLVAVGRLPLINGESLTGAYGHLAARVGRALESARQQETTHEQLLGQARAFRQELSGVSLDEEAALMIQYQRSYQAVAQMFRAVSEMTETLFRLGR